MISWGEGGAGHASNHMIHLKDHMIPVHSVWDVVTGSSESSAIILRSNDNGARAETTELEMA